MNNETSSPSCQQYTLLDTNKIGTEMAGQMLLFFRHEYLIFVLMKSTLPWIFFSQMDSIYWVLTGTKYSLSPILSTALSFIAILWKSHCVLILLMRRLRLRDRDRTQTQLCVISKLCSLLSHIAFFEMNSTISNFVLLWLLHLILKIILYLFFTMLNYSGL